VFTLKNPDRLVVDLPHTRRSQGLHWPGAAGAVERIRCAPRPDDTLRAVFELVPGSRYTLRARRAAGGYRLQFMLVAAGMRPAPAHETTAFVQGHHAAAGAAGTASTDAVNGSGGADAAATASGVDAGAAAYSSPTLPRAVRAAHEPVGGRRDIIVAVDAGHGGQDPGATGADGTHEKNVTLAIARALAARIDAAPGMHAVLTRDGDYFITLRERIRRAHAAHADLFVSIHADSVRDRDISGASVYILSERGATNEAARLLADEENDADLKGGVSLASEGKLASVLLDLSQNASIGASVEAADSVLTALDHVGAVRKHQVLQAGFVVLKSPDIPSMLVETAYISNPAEERKLRIPGQQQRLAGAIFSGIQQYFRRHPPDGTLYASEREQIDGSQASLTSAGAAPGGFGDAAILARSRD
jgi:N-acetylmuramoyl-L-alanine amidase